MTSIALKPVPARVPREQVSRREREYAPVSTSGAIRRRLKTGALFVADQASELVNSSFMVGGPARRNVEVHSPIAAEVPV